MVRKMGLLGMAVAWGGSKHLFAGGKHSSVFRTSLIFLRHTVVLQKHYSKFWGLYLRSNLSVKFL